MLNVILECKTSDASYGLRQIHTACYGAVKSKALCRSVERIQVPVTINSICLRG